MGEKYSQGTSQKVIAFCISRFAHEDHAKLMKGVVEEGRKHHCKVVFFSTLTDFVSGDINDAGEQKIFDAISVECYDAIVLMAETFKRDDTLYALVQRANIAGVPAIVVNKHIEGGINITFDYKSIFRKIVKHMVKDHGYRIINFMGGVPGISYAEDRLSVFKEVLTEEDIKIDPNRIFYGYFTPEPTKIAMKRMLKGNLSMPEAIICANDSMALAVLEVLEENGYKVPEDVAVSGFDGIDVARYPGLTTGSIDMDACLRKIFEIIADDGAVRWRKEQIVITGDIMLGGTCGCPKPDDGRFASEAMNLRKALRKEIHYQWQVSQMIANLGNEESINKVMQAVPTYMNVLNYKDFWFCANENLMQETNLLQQSVQKKRNTVENVYTKTLNVLHYHKTEEEVQVDNEKEIVFGELIPNRERVLEENDFLMVVPIHMKGRTAGYAAVSFDMDKFWFTAYATFIADFRYLLEMQKNQLKIMRMYMSDSLTGLYNRNGFYRKIDELMAEFKEYDMTIISLDMDRLKVINDTYGHAAGDEALRMLATIMQDSIENEIAARIGGDEFLIAFAGENIEARADAIVTKIKKGIREYNANSGKEYELHASIGSYTNRIGDRTLDHFLQKADDLMYARKHIHRKEKGYI